MTYEPLIPRGQVYLPFYPLARHVAGNLPLLEDIPAHAQGAYTSMMEGGRITYCSDEMLADHLGVSARTVVRYRQNGVRFHQAERLAEHVRAHPVWIWPDYHELMMVSAPHRYEDIWGSTDDIEAAVA